MTSARIWSGLCMAAALTATRLAAADAQQCVSHNNDGVDLRAKHQLLASRGAYRECVADPGCPDVVRAECETALSELKSAVPTLLISVLDAQRHDVVGATLKVDGQPVALDGQPLEVDPGPHELSANALGSSIAMQVVAVENEANRQVELVLRAPISQSPTPGGDFASEREPAPEPRSRVPGYVLGGVGVAAAASFAYFAISGHSGFNQLEQCKPNCSRSDVRDVRTKYLLADVSLGVSVVALATAGYLLFRGAPEQPAKSGALALDAVASPQSAGLSLRWVQ